MSNHSDARCDAGLDDGTRCKNNAIYWMKATVNLTGTDEVYPMAVCEVHYRHGVTARLGPDRRGDYAAWVEAFYGESPATEPTQTVKAS